jgi:ABC-type nitrate/sulfonate/bicarbonate transport system substrate-binding protein
VVVGACGDSDESEGQQPPQERVTLAVPANFPGFAAAFVAKANGYFSDAGVDAKLLTNTGANTLTFLTSKRADLVMLGASAALVLPPKGVSTSIVYSFLGGGEAGNVGITADSGISDIMELSGKRVGTQGTGNASWGWANLFSDYVESHGGKAFTIVPLANLPSLLGTLKAGRVEAGVGAPSWFLGSDFKLLVDNADPPPELEGLVSAETMEAGIFGLTENLTSRREAVTRFLKGIRRADAWLKQASSKEVAETLHSLPEFASQTPEALEATVDVERPYWSPTQGVISQELWERSLENYGAWGTPGVDVTDPINSYEKRVDMSYLDAASKSGEER